VIDSNIIFEKILHKDLEVGKFFEGFTILLHPAVHKECDSENGRKELEELARFSSLGRIRLQEISNVGNYSDADESIVESARKNNAILYTRDKRMHAVAAAKNVFFLV
jgi:rRNA-processing protein FCF1